MAGCIVAFPQKEGGEPPFCVISAAFAKVQVLHSEQLVLF